MNSHGFFSRMIALNAAGPNVMAGSVEVGEIRRMYICGACDKAHPYEHEAESCCPIEIYVEYQCPVCKEGWGNKAEAADCCGNKAQSPMQCPVCMRGADSFEAATECCLHTHPTMTALGRQRVAERVERGMSWADAVKENEYH